jgi:hypothetical protein
MAKMHPQGYNTAMYMRTSRDNGAVDLAPGAFYTMDIFPPHGKVAGFTPLGFVKITDKGTCGIKGDMDQLVRAGRRTVQDGPAEFYTVHMIRFDPPITALVTVMDYELVNNGTVGFRLWDGGRAGKLTGI